MKLPDHYSLKKDDDREFEIHDSRDNSSFRVAKRSLHPARQIQIMKMRKYADGGEVTKHDFSEVEKSLAKFAPLDPPPDMVAQQKPLNVVMPNQVMSDVGNWLMQPTFEQEPAPVQDIPTQQGPVLASMQTGPASYGMSQPSPDVPISTPMAQPQMASPGYGGAYAQQKRGIQGMQNAIAQQHTEEAKVYSDFEKTQKELEVQFNTKMGELQRRDEELGKKLESESNLSQYWGNLSTGSKIGTAISVMLGALGQGLTGAKENAAWSVIQDNLNKAVETNKELFKRNLEAMKDEKAAFAQTKSDLLTLAGIQIKRAAAQAGTAQAKANADLMLGQLAQQQEQLMQTVAQKGVERDLRAMAARGMTPEQATMLPQEIRKTMTTLPNGMMVDVGTEAKAKKLDDVGYRQRTLKNNLSALRQLVDRYGTYEMVGPEEDQMNALITEIATDSAKIIDPESIAREGEVKMFKQQLFEPGALSKSNKSVLKMLDSYQQMIENRAIEQYKSAGVPQFSNQKSTLPSDIQVKNGVRYKKVEGGWKRID